MNSESCLICAEDFNGSKRSPITCEYCSFTACSACCQHYILDQESSLCMNRDCQKEWTRKFVVNTFPNHWVSRKWKDMNAKVGVDKEKALFPATMGVVAELKAKEALKTEIENLKMKEAVIKQRRWNLEIQLRNGGDVIANKTVSNGRKCPDSECRGYLSTQWKCGLCEKWACHECHVIKGNVRDAEHTCDPDTLATAQLLSKDTKPCPKCSTPIHKIEGCDQMWCTQCHTAFSWRSGRIETHIHNPHFYEWQRRQNNGEAPRVVGDFVCGRELDYRSSGIIRRYLSRLINDIPMSNDNSRILLKNIDYIVESGLHLMYVEMPSYQVDHVNDNVELRIRFLRNRIDENTFKVLVQRANKKHAKTKEIGDILHLLVQTVTDCMYRAVDFLKTARNPIAEKGVEELCKELSTIAIDEPNAILEYCNECLKDVSKTYSSKCKKIKWYSETSKNRREIFAGRFDYNT